MGRMLTKTLRECAPADEGHGPILAWYCPGCEGAHSVPIAPQDYEGPTWTYDGNAEAPTLGPSIRHFVPAQEEKTIDGKHYPARAEKTTCHYFIRSGRIEFCGDCEHHLSGQTVDMVPIPETYGWGS